MAMHQVGQWDRDVEQSMRSIRNEDRLEPDQRGRERKSTSWLDPRLMILNGRDKDLSQPDRIVSALLGYI